MTPQHTFKVIKNNQKTPTTHTLTFTLILSLYLHAHQKTWILKLRPLIIEAK